MNVLIEKSIRSLSLWDGERLVMRCQVVLGAQPFGRKKAEGDGRTPEGAFRICLVKEKGKYGRSLGLSYPGPEDAQAAYADGRIDERTLQNILLAHRENRRPPWGSPLGGEIYIHEGGTEGDWTQGCIALASDDMDRLFAHREQIDEVVILP